MYISDFYRKYEAKPVGLGFVMTIYRRRLTSSFYALEKSLERRLEFLRGQRVDPGLDDDDTEQDDLDLDITEEMQETASALYDEEVDFVEGFLGRIRALPADSKLKRLLDDLKEVLKQRETVLVFTQYTDTMDYLRDNLKDVYGTQVACYSGRGGEVWDGTVWKLVAKEEIKERFRVGTDVKILLGTEAMSEGLNLQTCGVLINFDMGWNPMRVEQRIGRIDRIGQEHAVVWIRNYFYENSIEATVYRRLETRIGWFETVVGHLQPILSQVGRVIQDLSMTAPSLRRAEVDAKLKALEEQIQEEEVSALKLDEYVEEEIEAGVEEPLPVSVADLEALFTTSPRFGPLMKPHPTIAGAFILEHAGEGVGVTFRPELFDRHPDTLRLLTYGEAILDELLAKVPAPAVADDGVGRLVRCEAEEDRVAGYFGASEAGAVPVGTLALVRHALASGAALIQGERISEATEALRQQAGLLRARATGVREAIAVGDFLARKEEARIVLRRAFYVDRRLQVAAQPDLFFEARPSGADPPPLPSGVREFVKANGYPFAPLLRLLDNEEIPVSLTDPYLLGLGGKTEKSLRGLEQSLRDQALGLLKRLSAARDRLTNTGVEPEQIAVMTRLLR